MIEIVIIASIFFSIGFASGAYLKAEAWHSEDWIILKWSPVSLGYRPMPNGATIKKGDDIIMSLKLNTADIPGEGLEVVVSDEGFTS